MKFKNAIKHFNKICKHERWVFHYCRLAGIPWRGIKHDMSKFSPVEFLESVKYYQGTGSPIDACKKVNGWSKAWQHHKGRNTHHYEYWQDDFDHGGKPLIMPFEDTIEMLCDYLGAGHAYQEDKFTFKGEYEWWLNKTKNPLAMHRVQFLFITLILNDLKDREINGNLDIKFCLNKTRLHIIYNVCKGVANEEGLL